MHAPSSAGVAVVIPVFNGEETIAKAVASALGQEEVAEVVVVNDGSTDQSEFAARSADDGTGRLIIVSQANAGPSAAYNAGIERSRAELICRLDADDYFAPRRFKTMFELAGGDWDFVTDKTVMLTGARAGAARPIAEGLEGTIGFEQFVLGNISDASRPRSELGYLQPVIRRSFLERHAIRNDVSVRLGEDFLLFATALARGARFRIVDSCGYVAVARADSLSHSHTAQDLALLLRAEAKLCREPLSRPDRRALRRHMRHVRDKWRYRLALDAKQRGELVEVLKLALSDWHALAFMFRETVRARTRVVLGPAIS
ncbi:MAG TPA: glycosyltransferase family 2 protein [Caulobacteraceae bacterium]|jgi:succinoglycan biosynthesis protein ExoU|nr:glycosyltransferase family 2 protein [Caulobacteraceae bacterium]